MIRLRRGNDRGHFDFGWLDTYHTFSFGEYYDTRNMGFRALRVINEDRVAPGRGFGTHGHRDMEIVTYILGGALEHKDSLGTGSVIRRGDVQRMSAGTGVRHSEFNGSADEPVHLLQIWLLPNAEGIAPEYEERHFDESETQGRLRLIASPGGERESLNINQDVRLFAANLSAGESVTHALAPGRHAWVQAATGSIRLNGEALAPGDGAAISDVDSLEIEAVGDAEILLFDLA